MWEADFMELSKQMDLIFVDASKMIPEEKDMAYDYGHFTPKGDRNMGRLFADAIIKNIKGNVATD